MRKPRLDSFKNITIIQTAFIGDVALSLYLAQRVRQMAPAASISFVTTPVSADIARLCSAVDRVVAYDKRRDDKGLLGIRNLAARVGKTDCIIAPHRSLRTSLLTYLLKPIYSVGYSRAALPWIYSSRVRYQPHMHETARNNLLLEQFSDFDQSAPPIRPSLDLKYVDISNIDNDLQGETGSPVIAIAPGSVWETKRWPARHFTALVNHLASKGYAVYMIGGPNDMDICSEISSSTPAINLAGKTSIPQSLKLIERMDLVITNDSAPTHFSSLLNIPVIVIYGPTVPEFGFGPLADSSAIIHKDELQCSPCAIHGGRKCPIGTHECMEGIAPEVVAEKAISVIMKSSANKLQ
ncbi:MAG: glycosyltransferase family 9 protein [Candidatus Kapaibacterium sp.]